MDKDLHIKPSDIWIVLSGGKWLEGNGATEAVTVMPRAEDE